MLAMLPHNEPCRNCQKKELCETGAACFDFWYFVETGRRINKNRLPTTGIYRLIFDNDGFDIQEDDWIEDAETRLAWEDFVTQTGAKR